MSAPSKPLSLLPREHGAYAEMAFPQVTALLLGSHSLPAFLITAAVVCGFLLHEPGLVIAGRRGPRVKMAAGTRARRRIALLIAIAAVAGVTGLSLSPPSVWPAMLGAAVLGILVVVLIATRLENSIWGQTAVAVTFAAAAVPTALAGGVPVVQALVQSGVWTCVFVLGTVTVNVVIDGYKTRSRRGGWVLMAAALLVGAVAVWQAGAGALHRAFLSVLPVATTCILVVLLGVTPRRLRRLGWSMVASNTVTLILLLILLT